MVDASSEGEDEILDRLAEWQQGDFALGCGDFLFRDLAEEGDETNFDGGAVFDAGVLGFAVISQTCDIVRSPSDVGYVSVCPLVKIDPKRIADLERGQAPRYGLLSNTPEAVVVDFSRTMSVTKDLLSQALGGGIGQRMKGRADDLKKERAMFFGKRDDPCGDCSDGYCTMNCGPVVRPQEGKREMGVFDLKKARQRVAGVRADLIGAGVEWEHVKSGKRYWVDSVGIREEDGEPLVVYRDSDVGTCWIRPAAEFCDGRFVRLPSK